MEDETKDFFILIINTVTWVLLWMLLNVYFGIYRELAFFEQWPNWTNYVYYALSLATLVLLLRHLKKKWKL